MATSNALVILASHDAAEELYLTGEFLRWRVPGLRMSPVTRGRWELSVPPVPGGQVLACVAMVAGRVREVMTTRAPEQSVKGPSPDDTSSGDPSHGVSATPISDQTLLMEAIHGV